MRNLSPGFIPPVLAYVFGIVAIIVAIWAIISMIRTKNGFGGKVLSIILSGCIVAICVFILRIDYLIMHEQKKFAIKWNESNGQIYKVYESNAQIYKDDISSDSRLLVTCSEWITEDVQIWSAYWYKKYEYFDDEENFSIHVLVPMNSSGEKGNKSRTFKIQLCEDGVQYTVEPYEIRMESQESDAIQVGYFFRISDFYQICSAYVKSVVFESPTELGEIIQINETNVGILRGQFELIANRLER